VSELEPQQIADGVVRLGTPIVNWYLVGDASGVTIVDTGLQGFLDQLDPGLKLLGRKRDEVRAILLTHGDADHVGVAAKLQSQGDETPIHLHPADRYLVQGRRKKTEESTVSMLARPGAWRLFSHFIRNGALTQPKIERSVDIVPGQPLDVPGKPLAIHTPGHTEGHVVFHFPQHAALFVGDSICTWHPISGERGPQLMAFNISSRQALESLANWEGVEARLVLVGHGDPSNQGPAAVVEQARAASAGLKRVA
jgi:glyoxylase-like metal-dependent hydrolase (beta-lactamase superfamily II)